VLHRGERKVSSLFLSIGRRADDARASRCWQQNKINKSKGAAARLVTITKHLLCTRGFHLFLLRGLHHNRHLLPSRSIHVSFFTFTCCYSKISCPNRHLGSTLPTSLSSFSSTVADELFLRIFLPFLYYSRLSFFYFFLFFSFFIFEAVFPRFLPSTTPRLPRGNTLSSAPCSSLSPRGNCMPARARPGFFPKNPAAPIFYGGPAAPAVHAGRTPLQPVHL